MAKKVLTEIKLQAVGGQASPAPPVGPALGQHGVNIMEFVKAFNAQTQSDAGTVIPVVITVYEDRSFTFITKSPPAAVLIKQALSLEKGSAEPNRDKVARITRDQLNREADIGRFKDGLLAQLLVGAAAAVIVVVLLKANLTSVGNITPNTITAQAAFGFLAGFSEPFLLGVVGRAANLGSTAAAPGTATGIATAAKP